MIGGLQAPVPCTRPMGGYLLVYYTKKIEYVCMFVCLSFISGQTVGWNEMKLGMSDPWDMRTDIGGSSSRSKVTGSRGQGHQVTSINTEGPILCTVCDGVSASGFLTNVVYERLGMDIIKNTTWW